MDFWCKLFAGITCILVIIAVGFTFHRLLINEDQLITTEPSMNKQFLTTPPQYVNYKKMDVNAFDSMLPETSTYQYLVQEESEDSFSEINDKIAFNILNRPINSHSKNNGFGILNDEYFDTNGTVSDKDVQPSYDESNYILDPFLPEENREDFELITEEDVASDNTVTTVKSTPMEKSSDILIPEKPENIIINDSEILAENKGIIKEIFHDNQNDINEDLSTQFEELISSGKDQNTVLKSVTLNNKNSNDNRQGMSLALLILNNNGMEAKSASNIRSNINNLISALLGDTALSQSDSPITTSSDLLASQNEVFTNVAEIREIVEETVATTELSTTIATKNLTENVTNKVLETTTKDSLDDDSISGYITEKPIENILDYSNVPLENEPANETDIYEIDNEDELNEEYDPESDPLEYIDFIGDVMVSGIDSSLKTDDPQNLMNAGHTLETPPLQTNISMLDQIEYPEYDFTYPDMYDYNVENEGLVSDFDNFFNQFNITDYEQENDIYDLEFKDTYTGGHQNPLTLENDTNVNQFPLKESANSNNVTYIYQTSHDKGFTQMPWRYGEKINPTTDFQHALAPLANIAGMDIRKVEDDQWQASFNKHSEDYPSNVQKEPNHLTFSSDYPEEKPPQEPIEDLYQFEATENFHHNALPVPQVIPNVDRSIDSSHPWSYLVHSLPLSSNIIQFRPSRPINL